MATEDQAGAQAAARKKGGGAFNRVALQFPDTEVDTKAKFSAGGWKLIPVDRVVVGGTSASGDFAEVKAHAGGWVIGENDLQQVLKNI